jgi:hypothetical protein
LFVLLEDTLLSIPPTPKDDKKPIISINPKAKTETYVNDPKANTDGMNIKSFFRVSKTTPNLPQKIVVQMIEMHQNTHNNSLRHSLRSSTKKLSNNTQSTTKNSTDTEENDKTTESNPTNSNDINVKDETIKEDEKSNIDDATTQNVIDTIKNDIPPALTALQIPDSDKTKSLLSPSNSSSSSLVSPTSSVPKKKKKLNDCIAMLTCKIQEKLGVNFFENNTTEILPLEVAVPKKYDEVTEQNTVTITSPLPLPSHQIIANFNPVPIVNVTVKIPDVPQTKFTMPEQDEVIDLSIKKRPSEDQEIPNKAVCHEVKVLDEKLVEEVKPKDDDINCIPKCDEVIKVEAEVKEIEVPVKESEKCNEKSQETQAIEPLQTISANESENITESEAVKAEEITESFKISISKDRIPNLKEILENNSVITVNNLKISESERRAFEEQRIELCKF